MGIGTHSPAAPIHSALATSGAEDSQGRGRHGSCLHGAPSQEEATPSHSQPLPGTYRCFTQNGAAQHLVRGTPGSLWKMHGLSFSRSGQGRDRESAVCQGEVKQVTLRTRVGKH